MDAGSQIRHPLRGPVRVLPHLHALRWTGSSSAEARTRLLERLGAREARLPSGCEGQINHALGLTWVEGPEASPGWAWGAALSHSGLVSWLGRSFQDGRTPGPRGVFTLNPHVLYLSARALQVLRPLRRHLPGAAPHPLRTGGGSGMHGFRLTGDPVDEVLDRIIPLLEDRGLRPSSSMAVVDVPFLRPDGWVSDPFAASPGAFLR